MLSVGVSVQEGVGHTILQLEKESRTHLEMLEKCKQQRMKELKDLADKDHELCDIMCTTPFSIDKSAVPSVKQLESFRIYVSDLIKEKVLMKFFSFVLLIIFRIIFEVFNPFLVFRSVVIMNL